MSDLPDRTSLSSKPAQKPEVLVPPARPAHVRSPSSNNYLAAIADARAKQSLQTSLTEPVGKITSQEGAAGTRGEAAGDGAGAGDANTSGVKTGEEKGGVESPKSPSTWKPGFTRTQSWSEQDYKRISQGRLMESVDAKGGYSEREEREEK